MMNGAQQGSATWGNLCVRLPLVDPSVKMDQWVCVVARWSPEESTWKAEVLTQMEPGTVTANVTAKRPNATTTVAANANKTVGPSADGSSCGFSFGKPQAASAAPKTNLSTAKPYAAPRPIAHAAPSIQQAKAAPPVPQATIPSADMFEDDDIPF